MREQGTVSSTTEKCSEGWEGQRGWARTVPAKKGRVFGEQFGGEDSGAGCAPKRAAPFPFPAFVSRRLGRKETPTFIQLPGID